MGHKEFLKVFLRKAITSLIFTILWIPIIIFRSLLVVFISKTQPSYGKILDHVDSVVEEDYTERPPKISLVFTLLLDGPLELGELQNLFTKNVLEEKIQNPETSQHKLRYPELKQYQVDVAGYRFWKNDPSFKINDHIKEQPYDERFASLSKIHQNMINMLYQRDKSPWEMVLVQQYKNDDTKTLIILRCHHTLGDTKSILKVLVECLGRKKLSLPEAKFINKGDNFLENLKYYALMPLYFVYSQTVIHFAALRGDDCRYKYKNKEEPPLYVSVSQEILMNDVKLISRRNDVTTSAVIMCAIAGGIGKSDARLSKKEISSKWILPKPNHPERLTNYHYAGTIDLPTNAASDKERLERCDEIFKSMKKTNLYVYDKSVVYQTGTWFSPFRRKWLKSSTFPLTLTNIAGERDGFSIGGKTVQEFFMTCAPMPGVTGIIICAFSYKDVIRISATVKDGILTEGETQKLVDLMANEVNILKNIGKCNGN